MTELNHLPLITTIIPTFQRSELLKRAIASILEQTFSDFQLCIYDNASSDNTEAVVREFMKNDKRIIYHRHDQNVGMLENYRFSMSRINTRYYSILSDDDYLFPDFFEIALKGFELTPDAAFSACNINIIDEKGVVLNSPLNHWPHEGCYKPPKALLEMICLLSKYPVPTGVLYRHDLVKLIKPDLSPEMALMWDPDYLLQISAQHPIVINKKVCGIFLAHDNGFSCQASRDLLKSPKVLEDFFISYQKMLSRVSSNPYLSEEVKKEAESSFCNMVKDCFGGYVGHFVYLKKYKDALYTGDLLKKYFGMNANARRNYLKAYVGYFSPLLLRIMLIVKHGHLKTYFIHYVKRVFHLFKRVVSKLIGGFKKIIRGFRTLKSVSNE